MRLRRLDPVFRFLQQSLCMGCMQKGEPAPPLCALPLLLFSLPLDFAYSQKRPRPLGRGLFMWCKVLSLCLAGKRRSIVFFVRKRIVVQFLEIEKL